MYKLVFFVPQKDCENVKSAVFKTGAGQLGNYSHCSWQVLGEGQFQPLAGSNPTIGSQNQIEKVVEYRVEILVQAKNIKAAINALKSAHPYEEPAFEIYELVDPNSLK